MDQNVDVFTVGHSTLSYERFLGLLRSAKISAVADVRSSPRSTRYPHFNRDELTAALKTDGIAYAFLGDELGGRPKEKRFFCEGVADYEAMRLAPAFEKGIVRVLTGAEKHRLAMLCSEHNPMDCHRCLLVGRALADREVQVNHILSSGKIKTQGEIEKELLEELKTESLFDYTGDILAAAYRRRSRRVAFFAPSHRAVAAE